jgi:hypothetical protein
MAWSDLVKLVHIGIAFAFITGLLGRWILLNRAARSDVVETAYELSRAAGPFEKLVIRSSNLILPTGLLTAWTQGYPWLGLTTGWMLLSTVLLLSVIPFVPLVFLPKGRAFEAAMAAARQAGAMTMDLHTAFADPMVAFAHRYELSAIGIVVALMVLKPF